MSSLGQPRVVKSGDAAEQEPQRTPIGEFYVRVFSWTDDDSEIRMSFPKEAEPGVPNAAAIQAQWAKRIVKDLNTALEVLGGS